jgi:hypothetical protein
VSMADSVAGMQTVGGSILGFGECRLGELVEWKCACA